MLAPTIPFSAPFAARPRWLVAGQSPAGRPPVPAASTASVTWCRDAAALWAELGHGPAEVVLLGALAEAGLVDALRSDGRAATIVAVTTARLARVDRELRPRVAAAGELAALIRYLAGEPTRASPRRAARGWVTWPDLGRRARLIDLSEGVVRVRGSADLADASDRPLAIVTDDGLALAARARVIRRADGRDDVWAWRGLPLGEARAVRAWLVRAGRGSR
jgi:hypothetical protein